MTGTAEITIRPATRADHAGLAALHGACFDRGWSCDEIAGLAQAPGAAVWLAAQAGGDAPPDGFVLMRHVADEAEIVTMAVHPSARRCGIARRLVDAALSALEVHGVVSVFLEVAVDNTAAKALYGEFDFHEVGLRRAYYARPGGERVDALALRRTSG